LTSTVVPHVFDTSNRELGFQSCLHQPQSLDRCKPSEMPCRNARELPELYELYLWRALDGKSLQHNATKAQSFSLPSLPLQRLQTSVFAVRVKFTFVSHLQHAIHATARLIHCKQKITLIKNAPMKPLPPLSFRSHLSSPPPRRCRVNATSELRDNTWEAMPRHPRDPSLFYRVRREWTLHSSCYRSSTSRLTPCRLTSAPPTCALRTRRSTRGPSDASPQRASRPRAPRSRATNALRSPSTFLTVARRTRGPPPRDVVGEARYAEFGPAPSSRTWCFVFKSVNGHSGFN